MTATALRNCIVAIGLYVLISFECRAQGSCKNGGVTIKLANGTAVCYCGASYTGQDCSIALCQNGGTTNGDNCQCQNSDSFSGQHCQNILCPGSAQLNNSLNHRNLIFVIRRRANFTGAAAIADSVRGAVQQALVYEPGYLQYGLLFFNNGSYPEQFRTFTNISELIETLHTVGPTNDSRGYEGHDRVFGAILETLRFDATMENNYRTVIYVITNALPTDHSLLPQIVQSNKQNAVINFIITSNFDKYITVDNVAYSKMRSLAASTTGEAIQCVVELCSIGEVFPMHVQYTFFHADLVYAGDQCVQRAEYTISLDRNDEEISGSIVNSEPQGYDCDENLFNPYNISLWANYWNGMGEAELELWGTTISGQYAYTLKTRGPGGACSYRLFRQSYPGNPTAQKHLLWRFTTCASDDQLIHTPVAGMKQSLVAKIGNYEVTDASQLTADLIMYHNTPYGHQFVFASNGQWRSDCTYQLFFAPFKCTAGDQLYFTIFVQSGTNLFIQRAGTTYCSAPYCVNGDLSTDGVCKCKQYWTGPTCEVPLCENDGKLDAITGECICTASWTGFACQNAVGMTTTTTTTTTTVKPSMTSTIKSTITTTTAVKSTTTTAKPIITTTAVTVKPTTSTAKTTTTVPFASSPTTQSSEGTGSTPSTPTSSAQQPTTTKPKGAEQMLPSAIVLLIAALTLHFTIL